MRFGITFNLGNFNHRPMVEITQIKGDSETHPYLSPDDQYADFETWDVGNLALTQATTIGSLRGSYVRSALKLGLTLQQACCSVKPNFSAERT